MVSGNTGFSADIYDSAKAELEEIEKNVLMEQCYNLRQNTLKSVKAD